MFKKVSVVLLIIVITVTLVWLYVKNISGISKDFVVTNVSGVGFCGDYKIEKNTGEIIAVIRLCENNIASVFQRGDWVYIRTSMGSTYKENVHTGESEILNDEYFNAGITIIE